jgi:hypothetical protein
VLRTAVIALMTSSLHVQRGRCDHQYLCTNDDRT